MAEMNLRNYAYIGDAVWEIMDELVEAVKLLHPRVYESVLKKLNGL